MEPLRATRKGHIDGYDYWTHYVLCEKDDWPGVVRELKDGESWSTVEFDGLILGIAPLQGPMIDLVRAAILAERLGDDVAGGLRDCP